MPIRSILAILQFSLNTQSDRFIAKNQYKPSEQLQIADFRFVNRQSPIINDRYSQHPAILPEPAPPSNQNFHDFRLWTRIKADSRRFLQENLWTTPPKYGNLYF
jgi:hypothetical protein